MCTLHCSVECWFAQKQAGMYGNFIQQFLCLLKRCTFLYRKLCSRMALTTVIPDFILIGKLMGYEEQVWWYAMLDQCPFWTDLVLQGMRYKNHLKLDKMRLPKREGEKHQKIKMKK